MRTIKLTHEEIEIIKQALQCLYDQQCKLVSISTNLFDDPTREHLSKLLSLTMSAQGVFDGDRDI